MKYRYGTILISNKSINYNINIRYNGCGGPVPRALRSLCFAGINPTATGCHFSPAIPTQRSPASVSQVPSSSTTPTESSDHKLRNPSRFRNPVERHGTREPSPKSTGACAPKVRLTGNTIGGTHENRQVIRTSALTIKAGEGASTD